MIAERDIYADKNGRITDDPAEFAFQIAVQGCQLDERVARRYGIADMLVATGEPHAVRRVTGRNASSIRIAKAEKVSPTPPPTEPQEPAEAAEPAKVDEATPEAEKPTAKKEK